MGGFDPSEPPMNGTGSMDQNPDRATKVTARISEESRGRNPVEIGRIPARARSPFFGFLGELRAVEVETEDLAAELQILGFHLHRTKLAEEAEEG